VTGAALVALILALQPVSAAFNPIITLAERVLGVLRTRDGLVVIAAQLVGGLLGAVLANLMFGLPAVSVATQHRGGAGVWLAEVVATAGLVLIIFGAARGGRSDRIAYAVGAYIAAAYWFTSSTSFANPAVTIARMFSDSFAGIAPQFGAALPDRPTPRWRGGLRDRPLPLPHLQPASKREGTP
jgi:glycerol uptake facilitator-like aquaporin